MLIFAFFIIVSIVFYFYYKTKQFRTQLPIRQKWYQSKAGVALGSFLGFFGLNQFFLYQTAVTYVIGGIFIVLGAMMAITNSKAARHYRPFVDEETRINS